MLNVLLSPIFATSGAVNQKVFSDFTIVGTGTPTFGTTTVAAPIPAVTVNAGDEIIVWVSTKLQGCAPTGPAGFKRLKHSIFWNDSNGSDLGATLATSFKKVAVGGESGTLTFNLPGTSANCISATVIVIRKTDLTANFDFEVVGGGHRIWDEAVGGGTAISCRSWNKISARKGDQILVLASSNTDTYTYSAQALAGNAALTISTTTQEVFETANSAGNDSAVFGSLFKITNGNKSDYMTFTTTASASTLRAPVVTCQFIRIRQQTTVQGYVPGAFESLYPEDVTTSDIDQNGGMWNFHKSDTEGTIEKSVALHEGVMHFITRHRYDLYLTECPRRGESHWSTWQPRWEAGTKIFEGVTHSYRNMPAPPPNQQWIFWQNHTGSAGTSPNHPVLYLEWARQGQSARVGAGFSGSPSSTTMNAGELIVAIGMSTAGGGSTTSTRFYIGFPSISCVGNQDHRFEMMIKVGTAGNGRVILVHNGVTIVDRSDFATMATVAEELGDGTVGTGSVPGVGGMNKHNAYMHQADTFGASSHAKTWYDALIAAGGDGTLTSRNRGFKRSLKFPTDADYDDSYDAATLAYVAVT